MKAIIIEDEKAAVRNLKALLAEVEPGLEVVSVIDNITDSIEWFRQSMHPELIFMDIHLADGSAFEIFNHVEIRCPVIFTTAYDEYALKAFKVNSVDYLLKPIGKDDVRHALDKLKRLQEGISPNQAASQPDYTALMRLIGRQESYKTHFLIPVKGDKLIPVSVDTILFFHIDNGMVKGVLDDESSFIFPQTLDELSDCVNPSLFFRVNRQYLVARKAVRDIDLWFNGRLSLNLKIPAPEKILVSKARVGEFKEWFAGNG